MFKKRYIAIVMVALLLTAGLAAGASRGKPELSLLVPDNDVSPGEEATLEVYVLNGGEVDFGGSSADTQRVTTARNVSLRLGAGDAPIEVETKARPVGSVSEGVSSPVSFSISVDEDAKPKRYRLPVRLRYTYTKQISFIGTQDSVHQERSVDRTEYVTLRIEPDARFEIVDATLGTLVDDTGPVEVEVRNAGTATARVARLTVESEDDQLTFGGATSATTFVGEWRPGETRTLTFESEVAEGADGRSFPVSIDVDYEDDDGESKQSETRRTGVSIGERVDRFVVESTESTLAVGDAGVVTLTMRNAGDEPVNDARVAVQSTDPKLTFAGTTGSETFVGAWAPGETRRITFKATVASDADVRSYPLSTTVSYRDADGERRATDALSTGVVPLPEQTFEVRDVRSALAVGEEGTVRGTVVNTGETAVRNAVVTFESANPNVNPVETEYQVGSLEPGEGTSFSFDVEISDNAGAGPRQFSVRVRYRDTDDDVRRSDPLDLDVDVGPRQDAFAVEPVNATINAGGSGALTLRVTNTANETLTDISAKLFTNDPLSSGDDEAFIDRIEPGESETITFGLSAGGTALAKVYPADVDFQYDDADGDTLLSDTYKVPVEVTARTGGGGLPVLPIVGLLVVVTLGAGGYYWYRRR